MNSEHYNRYNEREEIKEILERIEVLKCAILLDNNKTRVSLSAYEKKKYDDAVERLYKLEKNILDVFGEILQ